MSPRLQMKPLVARTCLPLPLYLAPVSAGFPSPAEDYLGRAPALNELLISNPAAPFSYGPTVIPCVTPESSRETSSSSTELSNFGLEKS